MNYLAAAAAIIAAELSLGAVLFGAGALGFARQARGSRRSRRRAILWRRAALALWPAGAASLVVLLAGMVTAQRLPGPPIPWWPSTIPFLTSGAVAAAGGYLLLHAGILERQGKLRRSRRTARLGGLSLLWGTFFQLVLAWTDLLFRVPFRRAVLLESVDAALALALGMLGMGTAAFVGTVAGLSGKPRPAAFFASTLYVAGLLGLSLAARSG